MFLKHFRIPRLSSETQSAAEDYLAVLRVQVVGCSNLLGKDRTGFSEPFVTVTTGRKKHTTPSVSHSFNPIYDTSKTTFDFFIEVGSTQIGALEFVVWDKDWMIGKEYLGEVTLRIGDWFKSRDPENPRPLAWFTAETLEAFSVPLTSTKSGTMPQGQLKLRMGLLNVRGQEYDLEKVYADLKATSP
ncbi:phosphatidylserine decarboxylase [Marasmius sp. AFHP31]|nr:phosphatidylserine decarboxylase [Marasmius sp. AFHP31]KAK1236394.1 phosphatidylserine decarboxylase [Marasmius sp. AFHP31]